MEWYTLISIFINIFKLFFFSNSSLPSIFSTTSLIFFPFPLFHFLSSHFFSPLSTKELHCPIYLRLALSYPLTRSYNNNLLLQSLYIHLLALFHLTQHTLHFKVFKKKMHQNTTQKCYFTLPPLQI